jgi:hemerythrin-like domain-containing protein
MTLSSEPSIQHSSTSERTRTEHDELLAAMHVLEAALASPAPNRERAWTQRVKRDMQKVRELLEAHIHSAENDDGLFATLDATDPKLVREIEDLRQEHHKLLRMAGELHDSLHPGGEPPGFLSLRKRATEFLTALRDHQANEVDLIYERLWIDIGVGD